MRYWLCAVLCMLLAACDAPNPAAGINLQTALGGASAQGFERAVGQRAFSFPQDHAAHPAYRNEWWYVTGNLDSADGRRFGFQFTLFRIALSPAVSDSTSAWATNEIWMAHAAITDVAAGTHWYQQRLSRGAAGLAGQALQPFRLWLDDWQVVGGPEGAFPWQLRFGDAGQSLSLSIKPLKPAVLQGEQGLSQKGAAEGNASWYYSFPRLDAAGSLTVAGAETQLKGLGWLDREWSTSVLDADQVGWDWFSLQLDDGRDLMFYRLRNDNGTADPHSAGSLVSAGGEVEQLASGDVTLTPLRWWTSVSGRRYPVEWRLQKTGSAGSWRVAAVLDDQEMQTSVVYWEGAVDVYDEVGRRPIGRGYLEMAGY